MTESTIQIHATAIALDDRRAALILGPSGAGKSDLALRCILQGAWVDGRHHLATLVADDQVIVERTFDGLRAWPPEAIAGRMEVRGLGIVAMPHIASAMVTLAVELTDAPEIERLPDSAAKAQILGWDVPILRVAPFEASAHLKVLLALVTGLSQA
jgi:serine kinase of HPr protein (carbohydrate metabolism regulator)